MYIYRYLVAVGTTPGGIQVIDFRETDINDRKLVVRDVDLSQVREVFATVKGYNEAGLYTTAISNGVAISRISAGLPPLGQPYVYDGLQENHDMYVYLICDTFFSDIVFICMLLYIFVVRDKFVTETVCAQTISQRSGLSGYVQ